MVLNLFDQYSTAKPFLASPPQWIGEIDATRLQAYNFYEQMYWNIPEAFKLVHRGSDTKPIYVPAAKKVVETLHRYLAKGMAVDLDPRMERGTAQLEALNLLTSLFRRERFYSKFNTEKRYGMIRGDWLIHMYADPERAEGSRISVEFIDPGRYFPIYNPENIDEIIGCHLVSFVRLDDGEFIERLTYRKETGTGGPSPIERTHELYEPDKWGGPGIEQGSPVKTLQAPMTLPAPIDQLPVYHIRNFEETGSVWGSSELRGFERLITAVNQGISDEELALALEGLGVYATDAGKPVNDDGEEEEWNLGPARVVELPPDAYFKRVTGVTAITPYQDHLAYLEGWIDMASGTPDVAAGRVDVQVAESGIALALSMDPILQRAEEREGSITDVLTNFLFDIRSWFLAYESGLGRAMESALFVPTFGPKLPVNRKQKFAEIMDLAKADPPVVSMVWVRAELTKLGYEFDTDTDMMDQIIAERTIISQIDLDVTGARMDMELSTDDDEELPEQDEADTEAVDA